jgi:hypothetical protein
LEKLLNHYKINMPKINISLASFRVHLEKLENKPVVGTNMFDELGFEGSNGENPSPGMVDLKKKFEISIAEVKSTVEALGEVVHALGFVVSVRQQRPVKGPSRISLKGDV